MTSLVKAALLGVLQGLTEFLPVSSTAHLICRGDACSVMTTPGGVFTVMIQLGSILAVMWLYRRIILDGRHRAAIEARRAALCADDSRGASSGRCWPAPFWPDS